MLKLIFGKDWTDNREEILRRIGEDMQKGLGNRILLVPELISHDMERRLCIAGGDTSSRYGEVLSFTRLARRVADSLGSGAEECLDNGGRIVAMAAAARQLHSQLKAYAAVETNPEFLTGLVEAVDEFKRCCISAQDLKKASEQTEGAFAQKLEELALLLEAYDSFCSRGKRDPRDQMTWLLEQLEEGDYGREHVFYIDGFPDFTRQHLAILECLIRQSPCVTVSLNCDRADSTKLAFEKAGATARELIRCAQRAGAQIHIDTLEREATPLDLVKERLFQGPTEPIPLEKGQLRLLRTGTVYQECLAAAERILELVRDGSRYREISVVCTDMAAYQNTAELVFRRCGIPLYRSGKEDVLGLSVISAVLWALDAALGGLEQAAVLRYARSVLSPLTGAQCDRMENYAILWGIRGNRWLQPWERHPDGLGGEWNPRKQAELAALNRSREKAILPLVHLRDHFQAAGTMGAQVKAVYGFFEELHLAERLSRLAMGLEARGDGRSAQVLNQLWEILLTALEQMHDVLGETVWDAETFTRLFSLLLSQYDVGTIPPVLDAVTLGPVTSMRCQECDHLMVLGAQEGLLPGYGGSRGILTDQERVALRNLGVTLTGGAEEGLQAEFAEVYGVFCGAKKTILVSCPEGQPSYLYQRLLRFAGGEEPSRTYLGPVLTDPGEAGAYLARWGMEAEAETLGLGEPYRAALDRKNYALGSVSEQNIRALHRIPLLLSSTQANLQAECRLAYFLRYGLRAKERKEATVDPAEFGTYVHAVLEHTVRQVMELGGFHQVDLDTTLSLAMDYGDAYARERFDQLDSSRMQYLFQRNRQELKMIVEEMWRELSLSQFAPAGVEVDFGIQQEDASIKIGGRLDARLRGFVDRVDVWQGATGSYFRVVDYKTGKKELDYCDLFNGIGLQMLLYLFALEESGQKTVGIQGTPAGVLYFPVRVPVLSAEGRLQEPEMEALRAKAWKRSGLLLNHPGVLEAMEPPEGPGRLCIDRKKDGALVGDLADGRQFAWLKTYIFRYLRKMAEEIASGRVEPNPYTRGRSHNACSFCPYGWVCRETSEPGRRNYKTMTPQRFWEEIEKEVSSHG